VACISPICRNSLRTVFPTYSVADAATGHNTCEISTVSLSPFTFIRRTLAQWATGTVGHWPSNGERSPIHLAHHPDFTCHGHARQPAGPPLRERQSLARGLQARAATRSTDNTKDGRSRINQGHPVTPAAPADRRNPDLGEGGSSRSGWIRFAKQFHQRI